MLKRIKQVLIMSALLCMAQFCTMTFGAGVDFETYSKMYLSLVGAHNGEKLSLSEDESIDVDLNGDGVKETVSAVKGTDGNCTLYVNGTFVYSSPLYDVYMGCDYFIGDFDSSDSYLELMVIDEVKNVFALYRFNGKTVSCFASTKMFRKSTVKYSKLINSFTSAIELMHDGTLRLYGEVGEYGDVKAYLYYKLKNGKFVLTSIKPAESSYIKTSGKLYAYKKTSLTSNQLSFVVKKNRKFRALKYKISSKYVFMYIQDYKTHKKGWVIASNKKMKYWPDIYRYI